MLRKGGGKDGKQDRKFNVKYTWNGVVLHLKPAVKISLEFLAGVPLLTSRMTLNYGKRALTVAAAPPMCGYGTLLHSIGAPSYTQQKSESRISVFSRGKLEEHIQPWVAALAPVPLPVCFLTFKKNILRKNHPKSVASGVRSSRGVHAGRAQALKYQEGGGHHTCEYLDFKKGHSYIFCVCFDF